MKIKIKKNRKKLEYAIFTKQQTKNKSLEKTSHKWNWKAEKKNNREKEGV